MNVLWYLSKNFLEFSNLLSGGPADRAGLRIGDRIIEINGLNVEYETHKRLLATIKAGRNLGLFENFSDIQIFKKTYSEIKKDQLKPKSTYQNLQLLKNIINSKSLNLKGYLWLRVIISFQEKTKQDKNFMFTSISFWFLKSNKPWVSSLHRCGRRLWPNLCTE